MTKTFQCASQANECVFVCFRAACASIAELVEMLDLFDQVAARCVQNHGHVVKALVRHQQLKGQRAHHPFTHVRVLLQLAANLACQTPKPDAGHVTVSCFMDCIQLNSYITT